MIVEDDQGNTVSFRSGSTYINGELEGETTEQCGLVELWVVGYYWVKYDTEPEPVKKAHLSCRRCPKAGIETVISPEGFVFHGCVEHAADWFCRGVSHELGTV